MHPRHELPEAQRLPLGRVGLAALKQVAIHSPSGPHPKTMAVLRGVRDHLLGIDVDLETLDPLAPEEAGRQLDALGADPELRRRILRGMTLTALFEGEPSHDQLTLLERAAAAFGVDDLPVTTYRQVLEQRLLPLRLDIARRGFLRDAFQTTLRQQGPRGALAIVRVLLQQGDEAMAERHRALRRYPEGSFGRAYAAFIDRNGFSFPGEVGGPPPPVLLHDCCHVLGGYGTTAEEEGAVLGFQGGFERQDPFMVLMLVMAEYELGIGLSPFLSAETGQLDPERILAGMAHGRQVNADLITDLDPWLWFDRPLEAVRQHFHILPRGRDPVYAPVSADEG
jgi:hypothetical protein